MPRSLRRLEGKLIEQPEQFSGLWETPSAGDHFYGIWLQLTTRIEGAAIVLTGVTQYEETFSVSLFRRTGNKLDFGENSSFSDEPDGGLTWDGKHLEARRGLHNNDALTTEIDLNYDAAMATWSGFYRKESFAKVVTLERSDHVFHAGYGILAGTWAGTEKWNHAGLHIVQLADGNYAGWSDLLWTSGRLRHTNGLRPPTSTLEH